MPRKPNSRSFGTRDDAHIERFDALLKRRLRLPRQLIEITALAVAELHERLDEEDCRKKAVRRDAR